MQSSQTIPKISFFSALCFILFACQGHKEPPTEVEQCAQNCQDDLLLHVPSPEWQDQIIYFAMLDRFADGDPSNNDQGANEYDPTKESHYSGGDLKGVIKQLDYIQNLGATAVWTTPQVANQWWDPLSNYGGYHGYWARDFKKVDQHYGDIGDYQQLSSALHHKGMYLIQDIVVNHMGNFFTYKGEYDPTDVSKNFSLNQASMPGGESNQPPFNMNDVRDPAHRKAAIYHWTPSIQDFSAPEQQTTYQTSDLDDLNTTNPVVRAALKQSFGFWIEQAGVDAVRVDTAKYVEKAFYADFLHGKNGLIEQAEKTGRDDFFSFGEVFQTSGVLDDNGEKVLKQYVSQDSVKSMSSVIGFPLFEEISRVFAQGAPTAQMSYRLNAQMRHFEDPFLLTNFIDNHDVERFLASGSISGFKQAYALMMTVPGIPVIYQGDEQGFTHRRRAMFAGGYLSNDDQFEQNSDLYRFIQTLTGIRKAHKVFSRGQLAILRDNPSGAGVLVYKRTYAGQVAYVIFNTAKQAVLLNALKTEFSTKNPAQLLMSQGLAKPLEFDDNGLVTSVLAPESFAILVGQEVSNKVMSEAQSWITIDSIQGEYSERSQANIAGQVNQPNMPLLAVIDGKMTQAKSFQADDSGHWQFALNVFDLGTHQHSVEIYAPEVNRASRPYFYQTYSSAVQYSANIQDPKDDDHGPSGDYVKPLDNTVGCQMDILQAQASAGGTVLKLKIRMCDLSSVWLAPNDFDHVAFSIFFDLADKQGLGPLPNIGGHFPENKNWDLAHIVYGWGNYLYQTEQASMHKEGEKLGIAPVISIDSAVNTITFTYHGQDIDVQSWQGTSIYITTWDKSGEGNYRDLKLTPAPWSFASKTPTGPKILDDAFLTLTAD